MFSNVVIKQELRIAGKNAGKAVTITPEANGVYQELVKLARKGNHWAEITVRALHQLAAGHLHQNNIFIKPGPVHTGSGEEFVMILPGCKVTVEKQPEDSYKVLRFEMDLNYGALMHDQEQPGLYQAKLEGGDGWKAASLKTGKLTKNEKYRLVAICNSGYDNADLAANGAAPSVSNTSISNSLEVDRSGFDLHFTPGERKIGGMRNSKDARRPLESQSLHVSALLLARTMFQARKDEGVRWISEFGGSGVLTQALKILADQGVRLEDHHAFLYRPMTSPLEAIKAAHTVGLKLDRNFTKVEALDWIGTRDMPEVIRQRLKNEEGYKLTMGAADMTGAVKSLVAGGAFVASSGGAIAAAAGVNVGAIAVAAGANLAGPAAALAFIGAMAAAAGPATKAAMSAGATADTALKNWAPRLHQKIKSRF